MHIFKKRVSGRQKIGRRKENISVALWACQVPSNFSPWRVVQAVFCTEAPGRESLLLIGVVVTQRSLPFSNSPKGTK